MNLNITRPKDWGTKEHANKWFEKIANYKEEKDLREICVNYETVNK